MMNNRFNRWVSVCLAIGVSMLFPLDVFAASTELISRNTQGAPGNSGSGYPSISGDGRYVAFTSRATNLAEGDTNAIDDIFVRDLATGETVRVSVDSHGTQGNGYSVGRPVPISFDGRYVAFMSNANNLVPGDTNASSDVFLHDRDADNDGIFDEAGAITTSLVSVSYDGGFANLASMQYLAISSDGRHVVFSSAASNLVPGDTNGRVDVFVRDMHEGVTKRVSVNSAGEQGNEHSYVGSISADGRYVAYSSDATNLVIGDGNLVRDIFVHDTVTGVTVRVSKSSSGVEGDKISTASGLFISGDGRFVAFSSQATNLDPRDANTYYDVFVHDRDSDGNGVYDEPGGFSTVMASIGSNGETGDHNSGLFELSISADGRYIAYLSAASTLVPGYGPGIVLHDRLAGINEMISVDTFGNQPGGVPRTPSISWDGFRVAFHIDIPLDPDDVNDALDTYVRFRCGDADGDGFTNCEDCDDSNASIYPGAPEVPYNGIDENCNGLGDDDDLDLDGYGIAVDCNDSAPSVYPGAPESKHDGIDQDCNGYDLTIDITKANYLGLDDSLKVEATSSLAGAANLELVNYGFMTWKPNQMRWGLGVLPAGGNPGIVTVCGVEGCESTVVSAQ